MGMNVLSRFAGEHIRITIPPGFTGGEIWLTVTQVSREKARIGLTAPRDCGIARSELLPDSELPEFVKEITRQSQRENQKDRNVGRKARKQLEDEYRVFAEKLAAENKPGTAGKAVPGRRLTDIVRMRTNAGSDRGKPATAGDAVSGSPEPPS